MVWWPFGKQANTGVDNDNTKVKESVEPVITNYSKGQKILLEDTNPRFNTEMSQSQAAKSQEQASLMKAWDSISRDDFSMSKLTSIPCFRDAGLIGFTSMFVVGTVTFLYHKNPTRSANWSVGGLLLGSIVGWEQCRLRRKRSFQIAQMARKTVAAKENPMLKPVTHDESLKHQWDGHTSTSNDIQQERQSKSWYKFW